MNYCDGKLLINEITIVEEGREDRRKGRGGSGRDGESK